MKLGVITNNRQGLFQHAVIEGIRQVAEARGCSLVVESYAEDPDRPRPISLDLPALAGVLVIANAAPADLLHSIYQTGKPLSLICHQVPGASIPVVKSNNAQGIAELVRHLVVTCNRRKLVFLRGLMDQNDGQERETAFRQELIRHNLNPDDMLFVRGDFSPAVAAESINELIARAAKFDGILAADYVMGIAAVETLRRAGIAVPEAVSVVGFGDSIIAEKAGLTTVTASVTELGRCAARQVISQIHGAQISGVTMLNVQLVVRDT